MTISSLSNIRRYGASSNHSALASPSQTDSSYFIPFAYYVISPHYTIIT